jgi:HEAT repeat protein
MLDADLPKHQQIAALHGAVRARGAEGLPLLVELLGDDDKARFAVALRMAHELAGDKVKQALIEALDDLPRSRRALVIYVLGNLGDDEALPAVLKAAKSGEPEIQVPAVRVLATLGDASAVPVLLEAAADADEELASAARESLAELPGDDVDAVLAEKLAGSAGAQRLVLIELAGQRGIETAVPALLKLADNADQTLRSTAIAALGLTVSPDDMSALVDQLIQPKTPDDAAAFKAALSKAVLRMPDRDACAARLLEPMATAPVAAKGQLLELLGVVGGAKALEGVVAAASDSDDAVQDVATRVLGEWMSPDAAPKLLELARALDEEKYKIRALRGYIRIPRQFGLPEDERLAMCRNALEIAERDAERELVLDALTRIPSKETLDLVVSHLENAALRDAAGSAAVAIAEKLLQTERAAVGVAMQKVIDAGATGETAVQARLLLRRSKR